MGDVKPFAWVGGDYESLVAKPAYFGSDLLDVIVMRGYGTMPAQVILKLWPEAALELAEYLTAWAGDITATCLECKRPVLKVEAKAIGQDFLHSDCLRLRERAWLPKRASP